MSQAFAIMAIQFCVAGKDDAMGRHTLQGEGKLVCKCRLARGSRPCDAHHFEAPAPAVLVVDLP